MSPAAPERPGEAPAISGPLDLPPGPPALGPIFTAQSTLSMTLLIALILATSEIFDWTIAQGSLRESQFLSATARRPARLLLVEKVVDSGTGHWRLEVIDPATGQRLLRKTSWSFDLRIASQGDPDRLWMSDRHNGLHARDQGSLEILFDQGDIEAKNPALQNNIYLGHWYWDIENHGFHFDDLKGAAHLLDPVTLEVSPAAPGDPPVPSEVALEAEGDALPELDAAERPVVDFSARRVVKFADPPGWLIRREKRLGDQLAYQLVRRSDQATQWVADLPYPPQQARVVDGKLVVVYDKGTLQSGPDVQAFDPQTGQWLWTYTE